MSFRMAQEEVTLVWSLGRRAGSGGWGRGSVVTQAAAAAEQLSVARFTPPGNGMKARKKSTGPWVAEDLSRSSSPITLLAGLGLQGSW